MKSRTDGAPKGKYDPIRFFNDIYFQFRWLIFSIDYPKKLMYDDVINE